MTSLKKKSWSGKFALKRKIPFESKYYSLLSGNKKNILSCSTSVHWKNFFVFVVIVGKKNAGKYLCKNSFRSGNYSSRFIDTNTLVFDKFLFKILLPLIYFTIITFAAVLRHARRYLHNNLIRGGGYSSRFTNKDTFVFNKFHTVDKIIIIYE